MVFVFMLHIRVVRIRGCEADHFTYYCFHPPKGFPKSMAHKVQGAFRVENSP